jgi:lysozyme
VFIRATVGKDRKDLQFNRNWLGAKENKMIRGAYHYYRQFK